LSVGDSFFTPDRRDIGIPRHLWVILSEPNVAGQVVIANFSSDPAANDPKDIIDGRAHPSLSQGSHVRCDWARLTSLEILKTDDRLKIQWTKPASAELVAQMKAILLKSVHTRQEVKAALK
jgi:hypothetical protein